MAKLSQISQKVHKILRYYFPHFAGETILFLFLLTAISANLFLRANSGQAQTLNRSLFFVYLKDHPEANTRLVDAYESLSQKLAVEAAAPKLILGAATKQQNSESPAMPAPLATLSGSTVLKPNPSASDAYAQLKRDIAVYEVRPGDTVARIASSFGVSEYTITEENNLSASALIKPGQELRILPTSGVKHTIKDGETLEGIAKKYKVGLEDILEYNEIEIAEFLQIGDELIIPGGTDPKPVTPKRQQYLADVNKNDYQKVEVPDFLGGRGEYIWPMPAAHRLSQSYRKRHPAIDVPCRDCEVLAADDGIVEIAGWQPGYGKTILVNHGGGRKTRYGHASNLFVSAGDRVAVGEAIMISGNTGRSTGPHLHFEIIENGIRINPLNRVK